MIGVVAVRELAAAVAGAPSPPVLPANVYPVLVEVPPDGVHDGLVVRPCGPQPDVLEAMVYVPQGIPLAATEQEPGSDDEDDRGRYGRDRRESFTHGDLHSQRYRGPATNVKLSTHLTCWRIPHPIPLPNRPEPPEPS